MQHRITRDLALLESSPRTRIDNKIDVGSDGQPETLGKADSMVRKEQIPAIRALPKRVCIWLRKPSLQIHRGCCATSVPAR
jgi:hypothetical protein